MPERSYQRYHVSKQFKYRLPGTDFGYDDTLQDTAKQYQKYLKKHKEKFDVSVIFYYLESFILIL